jgi:hypothetical protein
MRKDVRAGAPILLALALALAGCDRLDADAAMVAAQPARMPVRAATPFSGALACVNRLLIAQAPPARVDQWPEQLQTVPVSVGIVPDATGRINPGLRDMITTALATVTANTGRYALAEALDINSVAAASRPGEPLLGGSTVGMQVGPEILQGLQIVGSLSQADRGVQAQNAEAGLGFSENIFGISMNGDVSTVAVDLRLVHLGSRLVRTNAANSLVLRNSARAVNASFRIGSVGLNAEYSLERREGPHQAVRTLIELSVAEMIGKHASVDYWTCLQPGQDAPDVRQRTANAWRDMTPSARDAYVRARLPALGIALPAPPAGYQRSLAEFQAGRSLPATGVLDYETYHALVTAGVPADQPLPAGLPAVPPAGPPRLSIRVAENAVAPGDGRSPTLSFEVASDRLGYLHCYYRDEAGRILQLLSNQPTPPRIAPDQPRTIPPRDTVGAVAPFLIRPARLTPEVGFLCLVAPEPGLAERLPPALRAPQFREVPVRSFEDLAAAYQALAPGQVGFLITTRGQPAGHWARLRSPQ